MITYTLADVAEKTQAEALIRLLNAYANEPEGGSQPLPEFTRNNLAQTLAQKNDCSIIFANDEKQVIGICIGFDAFSTFACKPILNIHDVYVDPKYRGQGIAGKMIQHVKKIAQNKNYCKITLEVLSQNNGAKSAYKKIGFKPYQLDKLYGAAEFWQKKL